VRGELLVLGVKAAASTVPEILREAGIDPSPSLGRSGVWRSVDKIDWAGPSTSTYPRLDQHG
jgi:hypothetical protein